MEDSNDTFMQSTLQTFDDLTKKPEVYLSIQENKSLQIRSLLKNLYDFTKQNEETISDNNALQTLITNDFDEEQIWQQLELQNESTWPGFITNVSRFYSNRNNLQFQNDENVEEDAMETSENEENGVEVPQAEDSASENDSENEIDEFSHDSDDDDDDEKQHKKKGKAKNFKPSVVDDKFFKLGELESFLNEQDRKEMNGDKLNINNASDSEDSEESIDLFDAADSEIYSDEDEEQNDNDDDEDDRQKYPRYEDFFDDPEGESEKTKTDKKFKQDLDDYSDDSQDESKDQDDLDETDNVNGEKRVRFNLAQSDSDDNSDDSSENEEEQNGKSKDEQDIVKSTFEIRQERLQKKIGHLEKAALDEKPWQLKGEIDASNRPPNSLLEEVLEFDLTSRPAPVITQETTLKLEDIIRRRIKDKAWDDVERKMKPVDAPLEYKKKLVLNQEKSKESLAQIYEQEYIKQKEALDPELSEKPEEEPKEHLEIKEMMTSLFAKLDALSNFHYTPRPIIPEIKIVNNLPAISMEEVAPIATSDATLLAPQEVQKKAKGDLIGKSERTATDKKRERRQKKLKQRNREQERQQKEKLLNKLKPGLGNKYSKEKASKLLDKLSNERNIDKLDTLGDIRATKSSTAFFTQLQEEVQGQIKSKMHGSNANSKSKKKITAKKVKL